MKKLLNKIAGYVRTTYTKLFVWDNIVTTDMSAEDGVSEFEERLNRFVDFCVNLYGVDWDDAAWYRKRDGMCVYYGNGIVVVEVPGRKNNETLLCNSLEDAKKIMACIMIGDRYKNIDDVISAVREEYSKEINEC